MARKASVKGAKPKAKAAPKKAGKPAASKKAAPRKPAARRRGKPDNAADALIGLIESPLVADLLAAAVTAAAATVIEHKLKKGRSEKSLIRAVGAATAAAVGKQLAAELQEVRKAGRSPKAAK